MHGEFGWNGSEGGTWRKRVRERVREGKKTVKKGTKKRDKEGGRERKKGADRRCYNLPSSGELRRETSW